MKRIVIKIEGAVLDLPSDLTAFKLTFALKDSKGIAVNTGSRSEYSFKFPATKKNNQIFKRFWKASILNPEVQQFREATIEIDGLPYFRGKAQLTEAGAVGNIYSRKGDSFSVAFYGSNIDWVTEIRDKKIYEYPFSTHTFNNTTIRNSFSNTYPAEDYSYSLIKYKSWNFTNKVQLEEFTPALSIAAIFAAIFSDLGYSINSSFISSEFFSRLYLPVKLPPKLGGAFSTDYLNIKGEDLSVDVSTITIGSPYPYTQTEAPAVGSNPYSLGEYTAPFDGFYRIRVRGNLSNITGSLGFTLTPTLDRAGFLIPLLTVGDLDLLAYTSDTNLSGEIIVELTAGEKLIVLIDYLLAGTAEVDLFLEIEGEALVKTGTIIDFKYLLDRKLSSLEFIKGLAHAFNLNFQTDVIGRTVTVEPSDNYFYNQIEPAVSEIRTGFYSNEALDFNRKIDIDKTATLTSENDRGEAISLSWKYEGETEASINELEELGFLASKYIFPVGRFTKAEEVIENPFFYATLALLDESITAETSEATAQVPVIWKTNYLEDISSSEEVESFSPRILYKEPYLASLANRAFIRIDDGLGGFTEELAPLFYMMNYNDETGDFISLSFANQVINGNNIKGLLERFYLADFKRKEIGKDLEEFVFWSLKDINNLDFREKLIIEGDRFLLAEINSFDVLSDQSTKTILIYDAQVKEEDLDKLEAPNITNKV